MKLELKDGDTRFTKGGFAHKAVNLSDKPFVNVTVELKKGGGTLGPASPLDSFCEGICWQDLLVTNNVQCTKLYNIDSHFGMGIPTPSKKLIVMLTEGIDPENGKRFKVGDILWKVGKAEMQTVHKPDPNAKGFTPLAAVFCEFAAHGEDFLKHAK